jgi:hypothetical protein
MRSHLVRLSVVTAVVILVAARTAGAQVCVAVDESRDTLSADERKAATLLLTRQFELAGVTVSTANCTGTYVVSHVRLGNAISVILSGPTGQREGTALGLEDLPALYSQLVRALLTGRAVGSMGVVDRTNVTAAQDLPPHRVASDSYWYARLGYGSVFSDDTHGLPGMGIGYRAMFDSWGVDVSFLNFAWGSSGGAYYANDYSDAAVGSWLKLEGMHFTNPHANQTPYFGGGLSWGTTSVSGRQKNWYGSGLAGELTAGYEIGRASSIHFFVQGDATLPFYNTTANVTTYPTLPNGLTNYNVRPTVTSDSHYTPSVVISVGIGWQKGHH